MKRHLQLDLNANELEALNLMTEFHGLLTRMRECLNKNGTLWQDMPHCNDGVINATREIASKGVIRANGAKMKGERV
jgi:hypothetical protein